MRHVGAKNRYFDSLPASAALIALVRLLARHAAREMADNSECTQGSRR